MTQTRLGGQTLRQSVRVNRDGDQTPKLYGLVELDPEGTVLYTRIEPDEAPYSGPLPVFTGRNFFTEVAPFRNVLEFRSLLDSFNGGSQPALSTDFTCDYEDGPVLVRLLFARIRERSQADVTKSVLVHIRRVQ